VVAASLIGGAALAQTTVVEKREEPTVVEKRSVEVTGSVGCSTTTKQKTEC
jgi:hypothetical protein